MDKQTFNDWAKKHNISTLYDYDKFENREFLKRLDETRPMYSRPKKDESPKVVDTRRKGVFEKLKYLFVWERNLQ